MKKIEKFNVTADQFCLTSTNQKLVTNIWGCLESFKIVNVLYFTLIFHFIFRRLRTKASNFRQMLVSYGLRYNKILTIARQINKYELDNKKQQQNNHFK